MSRVETLPDVDLEALVAEPLPPCEAQPYWPGETPPPPCGLPSVAVLIYRCACPPRRRPYCADHLDEILDFQAMGKARHGVCGKKLRVEVSS